jgi:hypothetical protein
VTLLHQYQRAVKTIEHHGHRFEYIEVAKADIDIANKLATELLFNEADELPPQTRKLLDAIKSMITKAATEQDVAPADVKLTARRIREQSGLSPTPVKRHLRRLVDLEYLSVVHGGPKRLTLYQYDGNWAHLEGQWAHPGLTVDSLPVRARDRKSTSAVPLESESSHSRFVRFSATIIHLRSYSRKTHSFYGPPHFTRIANDECMQYE